MTIDNWRTLDHTLHTTVEWLDFVAAEMGGELGGDRQSAWHALRGVLHALRDRIPPAEATDLGAQLPLLIRGLYYDGFRAGRAPSHYRTRAEFLGEVRRQWRTGPAQELPIDPERACRAVFECLDRFVTQGEVRQVVSALPEEVRALWPETVAP